MRGWQKVKVGATDRENKKAKQKFKTEVVIKGWLTKI